MRVLRGLSRTPAAADEEANRNHHEDHDEIHARPAQRKDCAVRVLDPVHPAVEDFGSQQRYVCL